MSRLRSVALVAAFAMGPTGALAQSVRGIVRLPGNSVAAGVVVQLLDSTSAVAGQALTDASGAFRLRGSPGLNRLRALRIGYRPTVSEPILLSAGIEVEYRFELAVIPIALDTIRVSERSSCGSAGASSSAAYEAWEQARTALTATQLSASSHNIYATTITYDRTVAPDSRRVLKQVLSTRSDYVKQPWSTASPDSLRRNGYIVGDRDGSTIYYAPGLETLLAESFIREHCFRLITAGRRLGIAFEPTPERKGVVEVRGTMWLDRASLRLEELEYGYANALPEEESFAGGDVTFVRMRDGAWVVSAWNIHMPLIERRISTRAFGGGDSRVTAIESMGGELSLARRDADTLWSHPLLALTGIVRDSASGVPVRGARVRIDDAQLQSSSDSAGHFVIAGLLPGEYTLETRTASLDSINAVHRIVVTIADSVADLTVRVPTARQLVSKLCRNEPGANAGIVVGKISGPLDSVTQRTIVVTAAWDRPVVTSSASSASVERMRDSRSARVDAQGQFAVCGVPVNTKLTVFADAATASATSVDVRVPVGGRLVHTDLTLVAGEKRTATFAGAVLVDSTHQPIIAAQITLPEAGRTAFSDGTGAFRLSEIPAGMQHVVVRHIGFGPLDTQLMFDAGQTLDRRVYLTRATLLDSVIVEARAVDRGLVDFDENRRVGLGHFFTRDDLAKRENLSTANVLAEVPGVALVRGKANHVWIRSGRSPVSLRGASPPDPVDRANGASPANCYAFVYLDNTQIFGNRKGSDGFEPLFDINSIAVSQIEAIEYYSGAADTPAKYSGLNSACGVLVIHTRRSP